MKLENKAAESKKALGLLAAAEAELAELDPWAEAKALEEIFEDWAETNAEEESAYDCSWEEAKALKEAEAAWEDDHDYGPMEYELKQLK